MATDIAARGLDIVDLSHVVNFGLPSRRGKYDASGTCPDGRPGRSRRESMWTPGFGAGKAALRHGEHRRAEW